jgi:predicted transcriptional regulator
MKTPCEIFVWYVLPGMRRELARNMIEDHGMSQVQVAKKLGVTEATVSQYLSKKRGNFDMSEDIRNQIKNSAKQIINGDETIMAREMCRLCNMVKESEVLAELYQKHTSMAAPRCAMQSK